MLPLMLALKTKQACALGPRQPPRARGHSPPQPPALRYIRCFRRAGHQVHPGSAPSGWDLGNDGFTGAILMAVKVARGDAEESAGRASFPQSTADPPGAPSALPATSERPRTIRESTRAPENSSYARRRRRSRERGSGAGSSRAANPKKNDFECLPAQSANVAGVAGVSRALGSDGRPVVVSPKTIVGP